MGDRIEIPPDIQTKVMPGKKASPKRGESVPTTLLKDQWHIVSFLSPTLYAIIVYAFCSYPNFDSTCQPSSTSRQVHFTSNIFGNILFMILQVCMDRANSTIGTWRTTC